MKKETKDERFVRLITLALGDNTHATATVTGCSFTGVHYDKEMVEAITSIAAGLTENAKSLGLLANALKAPNVGPFIQVGDD
jgi:hypothetical protein